MALYAQRTVVKPYAIKRASDNVELWDIAIEKTSTRKGRSKTFRVTRSSPLTDFTTYSATSQLKGQRDHPHGNVSSTVQIPDIPDPLFFA
ncbi:hypothetical protein PIB30_030338 [Stylosanthes scabra]|uniref:Uncharacterized protein n=1 Tax=Stylosanthes scabra TaxID=79078 RepID=A0ABU6UDG2_9FABA|nr:hypothetical protein [Stylosanthes scabra]